MGWWVASLSSFPSYPGGVCAHYSSSTIPRWCMCLIVPLPPYPGWCMCLIVSYPPYPGRCMRLIVPVSHTQGGVCASLCRLSPKEEGLPLCAEASLPKEDPSLCAEASLPKEDPPPYAQRPLSLRRKASPMRRGLSLPKRKASPMRRGLSP